MSENISSSSSEIPELNTDLYATLENKWWHIVNYYRNLDRIVKVGRQMREIEKPDIPGFYTGMNELIGTTDYTLVVALGEIYSRYQNGILEISDIETSPLHSFFTNVMKSVIRVGLIRSKVGKTL